MSLWRRLAGGFAKRERPEARVRLSDDAAAALARAEAGEPLAAALLDSTELAPFARAAAVDAGGLRAVSSEAPLERVRLVALASVAAAGRDEARCGDVLYALVRVDEKAGAALAEAGVSRARLTTFLAHGVVAHAQVAQAPRAESLEVVLHNDDYTPQDFVVKVLREVVGLDEREAVTRMLDVHREGGAVVATLPRAEAVATANRVLAAATAAGFPLLVTVESFDVA